MDLAIQKAIYSKLTGNAALMATITGVYDHVPQGSSFPYITIGETTLAEWGAHTFDGASATVSIHSWARGAGRKAVKEIMSKVYGLLHRGTLTADGFAVFDVQFEFQDTQLDPDGQTYHGVQRFRINIEGV